MFTSGVRAFVVAFWAHGYIHADLRTSSSNSSCTRACKKHKIAFPSWCVCNLVASLTRSQTQDVAIEKANAAELRRQIQLIGVLRPLHRFACVHVKFSRYLFRPDHYMLSDAVNTMEQIYEARSARVEFTPMQSNPRHDKHEKNSTVQKSERKRMASHSHSGQGLVIHKGGSQFGTLSVVIASDPAPGTARLDSPTVTLSGPGSSVPTARANGLQAAFSAEAAPATARLDATSGASKTPRAEGACLCWRVVSLVCSDESARSVSLPGQVPAGDSESVARTGSDLTSSVKPEKTLASMLSSSDGQPLTQRPPLVINDKLSTSAAPVPSLRARPKKFTLADALAHPVCVEILKDRMVAAHTSENICFLLEVRLFQVLDTQHLKTYALQLFHTYVSKDAKTAINIQDNLRTIISSRVLGPNPVTVSCFKEAAVWSLCASTY